MKVQNNEWRKLFLWRSEVLSAMSKTRHKHMTLQVTQGKFQHQQENVRKYAKDHRSESTSGMLKAMIINGGKNQAQKKRKEKKKGQS